MGSCCVAQGAQLGSLWWPRGCRGEVGGRLKREGLCVCMLLIHVVVQQKPIQYYTAVILQLKHKFKNKKKTSESLPTLLGTVHAVATAPGLQAAQVMLFAEAVSLWLPDSALLFPHERLTVCFHDAFLLFPFHALYVSTCPVWGREVGRASDKFTSWIILKMPLDKFQGAGGDYFWNPYVGAAVDKLIYSQAQTGVLTSGGQGKKLPLVAISARWREGKVGVEQDFPQLTSCWMDLNRKFPLLSRDCMWNWLTFLGQTGELYSVLRHFRSCNRIPGKHLREHWCLSETLSGCLWCQITIGIHGKESAALSLVQIALQKGIIPPS